MKNSQSSDLLNYLQTHNKVTQYDTLSALGIMRLSARVFDLRKAGYEIRTDKVKVPTRAGSTTVAGYTLVSAEVEE